jgi:hypothetical protein
MAIFVNTECAHYTKPNRFDLGKLRKEDGIFEKRKILLRKYSMTNRASRNFGCGVFLILIAALDILINRISK